MRCSGMLRGLLLLAATGLSADAFAGSSGTADVACGTASAGWNVPKGGFVTVRGSGPVRSTLAALGEYRTHSMLSHGPGAYVTHSTMFTPGTTGWPTYCSTPIRADELKNGYPGASQVNQGGIYTAEYLNGAPEFIGYQRTGTYANGSFILDQGIADNIADWLWNTMPYTSVASKQNGGAYFYRLKTDAGALTNYSLYQYRNVEAVPSGGGSWNNGMMCSSLLSYAQSRAGKGTISTYTYNHSQIVQAVDGLTSGVESDCNNSLGFWGGMGASITCFEGICDDASRQVANCMAVGRCDTDDDGSNTYKSVRNDPNTTATSVSPDRVGGWTLHPWTGYPTSGVSSWAADNTQSVQWNSGGNVYGCWF